MTRQQALSRADQAPRCQHFHLSGRPCGSPALTGRRLCYYHHRALRPKLPNYKLPLLEDATSVQFGLVQVVRALEDKAYDAKTCALLLYALQTASANLKRVQQERDLERRELQQAEEKPMSTESFADLMIRGLGLREPDPPPRPEDPAGNSWPPEGDSWPPEVASRPNDDSEPHLDTESPNPQSGDGPPERRGPSPAPRGPANDKRTATND